MSYGKLGQNFILDQRVVIGNTLSDLDGLEGSILGKAADVGGVVFYIVGLDFPDPYNGWKAVSMIESCLAPIYSAV